MKKLSDDEKYEIIMTGDTSYDGMFYTGVKTTGIFCLPSCTARKPRRKNVVFLETPEEAMDMGLRPCKRCRPLEKGHWKGKRSRVESGSDFITSGHEVFDHAIDNAVNLIISTQMDILQVALDSGFSNQSTFYERFRKACHCTPTELRNGKIMLIKTPDPFSFKECMVYLDRSPVECLHTIKDEQITKLLYIDGQPILISIEEGNGYLVVRFENKLPSSKAKEDVRNHIRHWFDLDTNLHAFKLACGQDAVVGPLIDRYKGLRIIRMADSFEAICWAILGQQINLAYAYTLKKRLVEAYGRHITCNGVIHHAFPEPEAVASLAVSDLKAMGLTTRKAEYLIDIAKHFCDRGIFHPSDIGSTQNISESEGYEEIKRYLLSFRGIGPWTADYVIMKCFAINEAFPLADVGIHNALKKVLGTLEKPDMDAIRAMLPAWQGWESYVAFYLWRVLYD